MGVEAIKNMEFEYLKTGSAYREKIDEYVSRNNLQEIKQNSVVYFCRQNDRIVGLAFLSTNPFHPYAHHLTIHIDEAFRRQGIGSRFIKDLKADYPKAYRVIISAADKGVEIFLRKNSFCLTVSCFTPECSKKDLFDVKINNSHTIAPLSALSQKQLETVKKLLHANYVQNHLYNMLNEDIGFIEFFDAAAEDHTAKDSYAIIKDSNVIGYLIAYEAEKNSLEIGYVGKDYDANENINGALYEIISKLFAKYEKLFFEVDSVDWQGMEVLSFFKENSHKWDIYFKK